jgi:hypothetical protein
VVSVTDPYGRILGFLDLILYNGLANTAVVYLILICENVRTLKC